MIAGTVDRDTARPRAFAGVAGPARLLDNLQPHLPALGITRLARQTHLDRIGVPCYAAIRPNSMTIASHQGKGLNDTGARLSAIMEAAEYACAEAPAGPRHRASANDLAANGVAMLDVANLLPRGGFPDRDTAIDWLAGTDIVSGTTVYVPFDAVALGPVPRDLPDLAQSTNGLAAEGDRDGALLHGLCELIERDAVCLFGFRSDSAARQSAVAPEGFADPDIDRLMQQIAAAGFALHLFDITTDLGIPAVYAALFPRDGVEAHHDVTTGAAAHPIASVAARRAIVEAVQTRVTNIAGARDDFEAADYGRLLDRSIAALTEPMQPARATPTLLAAGADTTTCLAAIGAALERCKLPKAIAVPLGGEPFGIHVLKAFVPGLEDRLTNRHWRAGRRAAAAMMGFL